MYVVGETFYIKSRGQVVHLPGDHLALNAVLVRTDGCEYAIRGQERQGYRMTSHYLVEPLTNVSTTPGMFASMDLRPGDSLSLR